tara:strand:- start:4358 stop:5269 length:912 start_codon:yes stop_codon:yes gene_type:complete
MYDNLDHLTTKNNRDIFFPVFEQDVVGLITGVIPQNHKMLTKGDGFSEEDTFLSIVKSNYRVVENEEVLMPLQEQMINFFDPSVLQDMTIKDSMLKGGATCFAEYILPRVSNPVETDTGHKTDIGLRFILKNAFDSSSSVVFYSGDIDFFCTNGQINGTYDVTRKRHTKNFVVDGFTLALEDTLDKYSNTVVRYQQWADTKINSSSPKVIDLFRKLTTGTTNEPKRKNALADKLLAQYVDEVKVRGPNVFSLVSALSNYSSHGDKDDRFALTVAGDDGTLLKRQEQVGNWLSGTVFKDFLEAV